MELYYKKSEIENLKWLGSGMEAKVYVDKTKSHFDSEIALKVFFYPFKYDHSKREKIRILNIHDIPGIIKPYDSINNEDGCTGYYMEYFYSSPLSERTDLPYERKLIVLHSLKETIERLHKKEIIVGDLREQNILVNEKDEVKICDVDGFKVGHFDMGWLNIFSNIYFERYKRIDEGLDIFSFNLITLFYLLNYSKDEKTRSIHQIEELDSLEERDKIIQKVIRNFDYSKRYIIDDKEMQKETNIII